MGKKQISKNFLLSEFNEVHPEPCLLYLLQSLRDKLGVPIRITDGPRTPYQHFDIYRKLSASGKIKSTENGLGVVSFMDQIPWGSRHLPSFKTPYLRAVDISVQPSINSSFLFTGSRISDYILALRNSGLFKLNFGVKFLGLGKGSNFCHIDVDRKKDTFWSYEY